jgi:hypothetical protein
MIGDMQDLCTVPYIVLEHAESLLLEAIAM